MSINPEILNYTFLLIWMLGALAIISHYELQYRQRCLHNEKWSNGAMWLYGFGAFLFLIIGVIL